MIDSKTPHANYGEILFGLARTLSAKESEMLSKINGGGWVRYDDFMPSDQGIIDSLFVKGFVQAYIPGKLGVNPKEHPRRSLTVTRQGEIACAACLLFNV